MLRALGLSVKTQLKHCYSTPTLTKMSLNEAKKIAAYRAVDEWINSSTKAVGIGSVNKNK